MESAEKSAKQHPRGKWYTYAGANDEEPVSFSAAQSGGRGLLFMGKRLHALCS